MNSSSRHKVLILDFGSQYTQLIARRVRDIGVYCEIYPYNSTFEDVKKSPINGIILSGGPDSVYDTENMKVSEYIFNLDVPILGICYGMHVMVNAFSGKVQFSTKREFGPASINVLFDGDIFSNTPAKQIVWMSHGDKVTQIGEHFNIIAQSDNSPIAAIKHITKPFYGVQFHPEVTHSEFGINVIENFICEVCQCKKLWTPPRIVEDAIMRIKKQVRNDHVILGLSGGVDSSVVAMLLQKSIGNQLTCIFVDTGLLRLGEGEQVIKTFTDSMDLNVIRINAENRFLDRLKGIINPEKKRKIIGNLFIDIFDEEAAKISNVKWLAQGTIYPDVIESSHGSSGKSDLIKSHHNVGGLPEFMKLGLVEPIKELFKDEVRKIALELGLPFKMVYRHPFPGPGLAVRIIGEVKKEYLAILRQVDDIFIRELENSNWYDKISQAFAVFLPVKSVGVMGDQRKYDYTIVLRAVETADFMTARWVHLPYKLLEHLSNRIVNEVSGISRVVYDVTAKPPGTIEWE
jgi:GMP synthase (glutamine-hydrolysing)